MAGKKHNIGRMWKKLMKNVDLDEPTSYLDHVYLGSERECKPNEIIIEQYEEMFESRISAGATEKYQGGKNLMQKLWRGPTIWKDMLKHAWKDIANWLTKRRSNYKVSSPCLDEHKIKKEELQSVGELSQVCSQIVLKYVYLARIAGPYIL